MNGDLQISYDSEELIRSLEKELDKLNVFQYDSIYRQLLGEHIIDRIGYWNSTVRRQKDEPLTVVVCGEFKRGKSSFINALLGDDVVTTDVTPETITVNRISYGPHSNEIVLSAGKRVRLSDEEMHCDNLLPILEKLPEKTFRLEIKRPIEILRGITIIDTPGLQDSTQDYMIEVSDAISQADVIVFVYAVDSPVSISEKFFLRNVIKPQNCSDLFVIANRADLIKNTDDLEKIRAVSEKRLGDALSGESPIVISALDERNRQIGADAEETEVTKILRDNFDELRRRFSELLDEKRDCIIPDRIERMIKSMAKDLQMSVSSLMEGLSVDSGKAASAKSRMSEERNELLGRKNEILKRIESLNDNFRADALYWTEAFIDAMEKDADSISSFSAEDIQKYYSFFCIDSIQKVVSRCGEYYMDSLFAELDKISDDIAKKISVNHSVEQPVIGVSFSKITWTKADSLSFASSRIGLMSALPFVSLAVDYFAGSARQKQMKKEVPNFKEEIKQKYPKLRQSAIEALNKTYSAITRSTNEELEAYFDDRCNELSIQHEQAAAVARCDEAEKEKIRNALKELSAVLDSIEEKFSLH